MWVKSLISIAKSLTFPNSNAKVTKKLLTSTKKRHFFYFFLYVKAHRSYFLIIFLKKSNFSPSFPHHNPHFIKAGAVALPIAQITFYYIPHPYSISSFSFTAL